MAHFTLSTETLRLKYPSIDWDADIGCGTHVIDQVVLNLVITWYIIGRTSIPPEFIVKFATQGFGDKYLPCTIKQLKRLLPFLNDNFIQQFIDHQKIYFALLFEPMEHKNVSKGQTIHFSGIRSCGGNRFGSFGSIIKVKESVVNDEGVVSDHYFARKQSHGNVKSEQTLIRESGILRKLPASDYLISLRASYYMNKTTYLILAPWCDTNMESFFERKEVVPAYANMDKIARWSMLSNWLPCMTYALSLLHERKIRHKDIKPANILLNLQSAAVIPVLCDFGLSKEYITGTVGGEGTLFYASPESLRGESVRRSGDIFSLGCVFLELACFINGCRQKLKKLLAKRGFAYVIINSEFGVQECLDLLPLHNPWWVDLVGIIKDMMNVEKNMRPTVGVILNRISVMQAKVGLDVPFPCEGKTFSASDESDERIDVVDDNEDEEPLY